jgi:anti-anti-sigma regulatory factor
MGSKFHSELHTREGVNYLKLGGVIDEDNDLVTLESKLGAGSLVINLAEVDRINSCGVRDWVNWLGRVEKNGARSILVECSPPIVSQINLVHNFTGAGVVKNFYAPYFCPRCEKEKLLLLETRDLVQNGPPFTAPMCRCDECDGPMEFDDMEESYFAFLSNAKKVPADPSVDAVMQEFAPEPTGSGVGSKLRRPGTASAVGGTTPPSDPQAAAPGKEVAALPSVPVVMPTPMPQPGATPAGGRPASGLSSPGLPEAAGKNGTTTTPGTPVALAQQMAAAAQAERERRAMEDGRSPLAWGMLVLLLLLAAGLLAWVFMT